MVSDHFDPLHQLVKTRYGSEAANYGCDICLTTPAGQVGHRCGACNIDLHDVCARYFKETISFFAHPWHTLKLSRIPSCAEGMRWSCDLCREECPKGTFVYRCVQCLFDVHPLCTMFPQTIRIPQHPEHDLRMVPSWGNCTACDQSLPVWHYVCPCNLKLHIGCVSSGASAGQDEDDAAAATQTSSSSAVGRPRRRTKIAKFLLKTSVRIAIHSATGGTATPVLDILAAVFS